jgi:hypothetical protein
LIPLLQISGRETLVQLLIENAHVQGVLVEDGLAEAMPRLGSS